MKYNIEDLTLKLETGVKEVFESDKYMNYLNVMSKFYNYSANNTLLICLQKPEATLVAGFQTWKNKFHRHVKKGEKAIKILAPVPHKYKKEVEDENGNMTEKEVQYISFRSVSVFDISQTEGEELPSIVKQLDGSVENYDELFETLKSIANVPVNFEEITNGSNGYYVSSENRIAIKSGLSEHHTIKTLIHEISHSILHNEEGSEKDADRRTKEVQAESVAYVVCQYLGLDTSDYSFGYVAWWSSGKEVSELQESMEIIQKTSKEIIEKLIAA